MKLFTKIFLCSITVITAALAVLGYAMILSSVSSAISRENENALARFELLRFVLRSDMLASSSRSELEDSALETIASRTFSAVSSSEKAALLGEDGTVIYSAFPADHSFGSEITAGVDEVKLLTREEEGRVFLSAAGRFTQNGRTFLLVAARDITSVFEEKHAMERSFFAAYLVTEILGALVMAAFSFAITKPINRLTRSTRRFASGELNERTEEKGGDEIAELSKSFNSMAGTIESTITSLELAAKQKDDFTSSFAHELKTPLTSVIGYADMIYQKKDLSPDQVHEAAGYILNEGMRLEALSLKLMELIVLEKQDFTLVEMRADEVTEDIAATARPMLEKKEAELELTVTEDYVRIEFDLFKTLVLNLIDNAAKAGAKHISVKGERAGGKYRMTVSDDGAGIPADQLERITEAFYMVDKSRSRKEHGAGLGLAIASRIAKVHGTELVFESEVGKGTGVSFELARAGEGEEHD